MSSSDQRNYYEILNSTSNATFDELKRNYKQLILQCHPDKLQQDKLNTSNSAAAASSSSDISVDPNVSVAHNDDDFEFVIINEAWNMLKDPVKRKQYDAELLLMKFQAHSNIFDHLTLADMKEHCETAIKNDEDDKRNKDSCEQNEDNLETYYSYDCRCGGQYVIDESEANENGIYKNHHHQKAAISKQQQTHSNNDSVNTAADDAAAGIAIAADNVGDKNKYSDTNDRKVMVECSECSLVIILSNAKRQSLTSS